MEAFFIKRCASGQRSAYCSSVGIQGITLMVGSWRPLRIAAFRSRGVMDSIHFEFSRGPTLRGRRLGMSLTNLETLARARSSSPAMRTSTLRMASMLFR